MVSIIILNYNTSGLVKNCIKSIYKHIGNLEHEIIVIDNDSADKIGEMLKKRFPSVRFYKTGKNLGYGGGNNLGIKKAVGKYLVILNPDTVIIDKTFEKIYNFMDKDSSIGVIGPRLVSPNGETQHTRCRFPDFMMPIYRRTQLKNIKYIKNKIYKYTTRDVPYSKTTDTDWVFGAFLFIRKSAIDVVGMFDEDFFLGFEDADLCKRFWDNNYRVVYFSDTKVIHYPHRFSKKNIFNKSVREHILSWLKYFKKHGLKKIESRI